MATPTKPQPGAFLLSLRNNIGLVCGFAATDSGLYYNRVYHRHKFRLYIEFTTGRPATAVRSSNRPALLVGQHLTGWKGLAVPYEGPGKGHFLRYKLRITRVVVVGLRLSRRDAASVGAVPQGGPLRAEGFPKRRCQFESVAAQRHLSPRRPADCERRPAACESTGNLSGPLGHLP